MMLSNGLAGLFLPLHMQNQHMDTETIGLILSMYAVGILIGGMYSRKLLGAVGHVRVFSAVAAASSISILVCSLSFEIYTWIIMRAVMGFSLACSLAVVDGWLSQITESKSRGRILALNQVIITLAIICSQFLINIAPVSENTLFIVCAILMSFSILPLILSTQVAPATNDAAPMPIKKLLAASPLGITCAFTCGLLYGALINILPIYASHQNIEGFQLSIFMASSLLGAFVLQYPVGVLSDKFDRRTVLLITLTMSCFAAFAAPIYSQDNFITITLLTAFVTGIICCLYPIGLCETLDRIEDNETSAALGGILTLYAAGYVLGPFASSLLVANFGPSSLYYFTATGIATLCLFVIHRMNTRKPLPTEQQHNYVPQQNSMIASQYESECEP